MSVHESTTSPWHKSSYSGGHGGNCLEMSWTKSSFSEGRDPNCVECRTDQDRVLIRDTRNRALGHLAFPRTEWAAFLKAVRHDELAQ
jgi:hypothetical protein